ncbi:MAG: hypothetical protein K1X81_04700 [Bacteroidia bacterium]|nr:hypothetical protein [Bacteroidia bacterium]
MTSLPILDLIAGLIFIYFLLSIVCNAIFEGLSALLSIRSNMLTQWITQNFPNLAGHFLDHTMLKGISAKGKGNSYLSASNFSLILVDAIAKEIGKVPETLADIKTAIEDFETRNTQIFPPDFQRALKIFIAESQQAAAKAEHGKSELQQFRNYVEHWFDSMMERVGGAYKRKAQAASFIIALITSVALNIDSIQLMNYLYNNPDGRQALAAASYRAAGDTSYMHTVNKIKQQQQAIEVNDSNPAVNDSLQAINQNLTQVISAVQQQKQAIDTTAATLAMYVPFGWSHEAKADFKKNPVRKTGGLLITIFAVCLGAPFWFDLLGKVANLRNSIKPETTAQKEKNNT